MLEITSGGSLSRPPGFDAAPEQRTPPLFTGTPARPSPQDRRSATTDRPDRTSALFSVAQPALLSPPTSSPPIRPVNRRKTLTGMAMVRSYGVSLRRASDRLKARRRAAPVAKAAESVLCRQLGIVQDGEEVTELAMAEFARRFHGQVPDHVLVALRALFKVSSPEEEAIDDALLRHGGAAGLDLAVQVGDEATDV